MSDAVLEKVIGRMAINRPYLHRDDIERVVNDYRKDAVWPLSEENQDIVTAYRYALTPPPGGKDET